MKKASRKLVLREEAKQQRAVTVGDVLVEVGAEMRELMMKGGLATAAALFTEEIAQLCGPKAWRVSRYGLKGRLAAQASKRWRSSGSARRQRPER